MKLFDVSDITVTSTLPKKKVKKEIVDVDLSKKILLSDEVKLEGYEDFNLEKYPNGFVFYDFEVFQFDWMVVLIDPINKIRNVIVNDSSALKKYYHYHTENIWVGYNNLHYDVPILKGILSGINPKEMSDYIIEENGIPYKKWPNAMKRPLLSYDVSGKLESLKLLEAYMGNDIEETSVPFDIQRLLTKDEIELTMKYCIHDVEQTIEVFRRRVNDFNASMQIIETFDFPLRYIEKTKGQLTAMVVNCERQEHDDEFDVTFVPTLKLDKYAYVKDWFEKILKKKNYGALIDDIPENKYILDKGRQIKETEKSRTTFETMVAGVPHQFGWGGLHGAPISPIHVTGKMYHADVTSYYPSMMIKYNFLTRNSKTPEKFKEVYDTRVALKKAGKTKEQAPFKIILNSQFGITKDKYSQAYDPVQANNICINGQLLLLDLIEKLEFRLGDRFELLQSNTDGLIVKIAEDEKSEKIFRHIVKEWCDRTGLGMGADPLTRIIQKDVNNYLFLFENGKLERKGAYVMETSDLSNNMAIVNEALVNYMAKDISVEDTINSCDDVTKFQIVYRISSSYKYGFHNGKYIPNKTFRVFASKDKNDGFIARCRDHGTTPEKFQNSPEHCFIYNKSLKDVPMFLKLDKKWYIKLAKKRLADFGYEEMNKSSSALF